MPAATRLYERIGFRRAPEFDIEIGEMFAGRSLPPAPELAGAGIPTRPRGSLR
jgi:hypothetical protein